MQVIYGLGNVPKNLISVLTIGSFDGVHLAHQNIIKTLVEQAILHLAQSVLITFHPHPRKFVNQSDNNIELLSQHEEKIKIIESLGVDILVIVPFDRSFSELSPEYFVEHILVQLFHPKKIILGYDHKFGQNRTGDIELLKKMGSSMGFELMEILKQEVESIAISSTKTREYLKSGQIEMANKLLGRPFKLSGLVIKGNQNGRKLGFPTANILQNEDVIIPRHGVYFVQVNAKGEIYKGALNIGFRPSIEDGLQLSIEVHILNFDHDIYGEHIEISFYSFLRSEQKFNALDELKNQIELDVEKVRKFNFESI